jgi:hypothetical protein
MEKYCNLKSLLFNIAETLMLIIMAQALKISDLNTLIIFFTFEVARFCFKLPKHYKKWQQCLIWTLLIFTSLFVVSRVDVTVGVMCSIFTAYILSGKADLKNIYLWTGRNSNCRDVLEYVKFNCENKKLKEFEEKISEEDNFTYLIYKYRFKQGLSFNKISELLDIDTARIAEVQEKIAFTIRVYIMR